MCHLGLALVSPWFSQFFNVDKTLVTYSLSCTYYRCYCCSVVVTSVKYECDSKNLKLLLQNQLEIVDQWSTRIPPPHRRGWQWVDCNWTLFKITRQPFLKRHSWQLLGFCLQPQRTCTWNLKLKFQSKLELRCWNHAIQKPKNLIWPPGSHLENEVTENQ